MSLSMLHDPPLLRACPPLPAARTHQVFSKLTERFGWQPMKEGELVIGVQMDGQSVTLEPGGQFELSGAPVATLHQTCAEVNSHLYQVKTIGEELGIAFLGIGFDPKWRIEEIPIMPKNRYRLMKSYMPTVGSMGLDMMFRTSTVQVGVGTGQGKWHTANVQTVVHASIRDCC